MSFFSQFPTIKYDINNDGIKNDIVDIFRNVDIRDSRIDDITTYTYYEVVEGERPDIVSNRLYGTPDYYWTFFVINEKLKDGLVSWPKSYRNLEKIFTREFMNYSVMVFIPEQNPVARKYENDFEMSNYFGGLDLLNPNLRLVSEHKRDLSLGASQNVVKAKKATAEIQKFDDHRFQMWLKNLSGNQHTFKNHVRWKIEYIDNPYTDKEGSEEKFSQFETERTEWGKKAMEWVRLNYTSIYYEFINDITFKEALKEGSDAYYEYFLDTYFSNITFASQRFYENSVEAPSYFIDAEYEEDKTSPYNAYDHVYRKSMIELGDGSYVIGESNFNVSSETKEDGFDQSRYEPYGDISRNRKYIPSFVKHYTATEAKYVSYADEIKNRDFESRKIRVIRPELIDQFVEIYQEKIQS